MGHLWPRGRGLLLLLPLCLASPARAEWSLLGQLSLEARLFTVDEVAVTMDQSASLVSLLEVEHEGSLFRERARAWGRLDPTDMQRSVLVLEELWGEVKLGSRLKLRAGVNTVNWTATEGFHPADVLNSRNLDSEIERPEKLGEPMASLTFQAGGTTLAAYYMPYHVAPVFPSPKSRTSFLPPGLELGPALRMGPSGELSSSPWAHQGALRLQSRVGDADVGLQLLHHIDRTQPELVPDLESGELRPLFRSVSQLGGTYQQPFGSFITKVEVAYRRFAQPDEPTPFGVLASRDHLQVAMGIDWGFDHDSGASSTYFLEAQSLFGAEEPARAQLSIFQRDLLVGYRLAFNDIAARELFLLTVVDLERRTELLGSVSYRQRLDENWAASLALRLFLVPTDTGDTVEGLEYMRNADHVRLLITRYF